MSRNFSFKGAWLCNPFSALPVAGRARVLQDALVVLETVGLDKEGGFTGDLVDLVPGAGRAASSPYTPDCAPCTLPRELIQHSHSPALAQLRYKHLISHGCAHTCTSSSLQVPELPLCSSPLPLAPGSKPCQCAPSQHRCASADAQRNPFHALLLVETMASDLFDSWLLLSPQQRAGQFRKIALHLLDTQKAGGAEKTSYRTWGKLRDSAETFKGTSFL